MLREVFYYSEFTVNLLGRCPQLQNPYQIWKQFVAFLLLLWAKLTREKLSFQLQKGSPLEQLSPLPESLVFYFKRHAQPQVQEYTTSKDQFKPILTNAFLSEALQVLSVHSSEIIISLQVWQFLIFSEDQRERNCWMMNMLFKIFYNGSPG